MKKKNTKWVILAVALVAAIILEVVSVRQKAKEATGGASTCAPVPKTPSAFTMLSTHCFTAPGTSAIAWMRPAVR